MGEAVRTFKCNKTHHTPYKYKPHLHFHSNKELAIWEKYTESIKLQKITFPMKIPFTQQEDLSFKMTSFPQKCINPAPSHYVGIEAKFSWSIMWSCKLIPEPLSHDNNRMKRLIPLLLFFFPSNLAKELEKMGKSFFSRLLQLSFPYRYDWHSHWRQGWVTAHNSNSTLQMVLWFRAALLPQWLLESKIREDKGVKRM